MNILDKIIADKFIEVKERKAVISMQYLEQRDFFDRECLSMKKSLLESTSGIISEFKRKSPSKGWINKDADAIEITASYCKNGASGISILTDLPYFGGNPHDLMVARPLVTCPILRKDFIVDSYQLYEAKSYGADVVLLIAAALSVEQCKTLASTAHELGLEVLLEVHNEEELGHMNESVDMVGVNNRNLKDFVVSTDVSLRLAELIPDDFVKISESGISKPETVKELRKVGYRGFLMGENFMKEENPALALKKFIAAL